MPTGIQGFRNACPHRVRLGVGHRGVWLRGDATTELKLLLAFYKWLTACMVTNADEPSGVVLAMVVLQMSVVSAKTVWTNQRMVDVEKGNSRAYIEGAVRT